VFASSYICDGQFVAQYAGKLISMEEGLELENSEESAFRFFFQWKGVSWW